MQGSAAGTSGAVPQMRLGRLRSADCVTRRDVSVGPVRSRAASADDWTICPAWKISTPDAGRKGQSPLSHCDSNSPPKRCNNTNNDNHLLNEIEHG